jgi:hypothetical protein
LYYLIEPFKLNYLWAALCIMGAVFFIFRDRLTEETPAAPPAFESRAEKPGESVTPP